MKKTLREIADLIGAHLQGDENVLISGISGIVNAKAGDITFLHNAKYLEQAEKTNASAIVTSFDIANSAKPILKVKNPTFALNTLASLFSPQQSGPSKGLHPTVITGKAVSMGPETAIGAYVVIEDNVSIGRGVVIYPHSYIAYGSIIDEDTVIYSHVSIREKTVIGKRVIVHAGVVIGADGFGYDTINSVHHKIPHVGNVVIEDDVEIGANVTIDRARFDKTFIGRGTKIDNLVHIAHNVVIGKNCIIVAQVGISGSTIIGDNTVIAGQAGLAGHLTIGDNVIIGAQAGVTKSVPSKTFVSGYPARPHREAKKINAYVQQLPKLYKKVDALEAAVGASSFSGKKIHEKSADNKKRKNN